jgi:lactoylglutathione lyase
MRIEHIALWVNNLEAMRSFYEGYFTCKAGTLYSNPAKQYTSYFLTFQTGSRLELMHKPSMDKRNASETSPGYVHIAIEVGNRDDVNKLTERLKKDGFVVISESRVTGDGYYESVILDPEKNLIELVSARA